MRLAPAGLLLVLVPSLALGNDGTGTSDVVGGTNAPAGKWPDVAAILFDGQQGCTGTLIAPNVVLTAGHCNDTSLTSVLIGTNSLANPGAGETIAVQKRVEFPSSQSTEDLTIVVLAKTSRFEPRPIATGWVRLDVKNDRAVQIVGYGAVDVNASSFKDELQEAMATITDADCTLRTNDCNTSVSPGGELAAGGMGIDSCNGDSGGPLYLLTDYGNFLVGVTSRGFNDSTNPCGDGGIYVRPDKVIDQLEQMAGVALTRGPEPAFDKLVAAGGDAAETKIDANDPKSDSHSFELTTPPANGTAKVRSDGAVRVCANATDTQLADQLVVTITDKKDGTRKLPVTIPITIMPGTATGCDVDDFQLDGGGCCDSGGRGAGGSLLLAGIVLCATRRRRR
jgi:hypothetical protein